MRTRDLQALKATALIALIVIAGSQRHANGETSNWLTSKQEAAFLAKIEKFWVHEVNADYVVKLRVTLARDGHQLELEPLLLDYRAHDNVKYKELGDVARRAIFFAQPFEMFGSDSDGDWRVMELTFNANSGVSIIAFRSRCLNTISQMCTGGARISGQ